MEIIRGELEATNALMEGKIIVDDLGMLMAFRMAFKFQRELFDAYLRERGCGAGGGGAA